MIISNVWREQVRTSLLEVFSIVLSTIIAIVCIRSQKLIHLLLASLCTSPKFPQPPAPGNHHSTLFL